MGVYDGQTAEPTGGVPSLTAAQITNLYQLYLNRPPTVDELASEQQNALKYSAAGIERSIADRGSNTAGSGVRGDEGQPALTVPVEHAGNVVSTGPGAITPSTATAGGPTGPIPATLGGAVSSYAIPSSIAPTGGGFDLTTMLILGAVGVAAYLLIKK